MNTESLYGEDYAHELRGAQPTAASPRDLCWMLAILALLLNSEVVFLVAVLFVASLPVSITLIVCQVVAVPAVVYLATNFSK
jgi:hypothetical protein